MPPPPKRAKRYFDQNDSKRSSFKFNVKDNSNGNYDNATSTRDDRYKNRRDNGGQTFRRNERIDNGELAENGSKNYEQQESEGSSEKIKAREYYKDAKLKQFRLIVRNLPFKTKKEDLQNVCSNFGSFSEIVLPPSTKMEGRCAGFGFIQFKTREVAEKAKEHFNNNKFKGRMVAADWALAKDTYETKAHEEKEAIKAKVKEEKEESPEVEEGSDEESETSEAEKNEEPKNPSTGNKKIDTATQEERVVFLRNLSFQTDQDTLKSEAEKYGDVQLAIMCKFKDSGHSKGTAFIHFSKKEEAAEFIAASERGEVTIDGRNISVVLAIPREKAVEIEKEAQKKIPSDNRNLRLLRFSLIREGTSAAAGMSSEDAAKRAKYAEVARKKLENLHMFVSPVRLVVHNLPLNMSDLKLRDICKEASGEGASITECRIWKDPERLNSKGEPKSKGFAFVTFKEHTHALQCLQKLNNNPKTFTNEKRPIVEFSIENIAALQAKERRKTASKGAAVNVKQLNEKVRKQVQESIGKIHLSGMKFLPKLVGKKMRHRNMSKNKKKKLGLIKKDKKADSSSVQKNKKKSSKKTLTKYLALSN